MAGLPTPPVVVSIDFETCSPLDLKKVGAWRYSEHPETRIICLAWRAIHPRSGDLMDAGVWTAGQGEGLPPIVWAAAQVKEQGLQAWNAHFEIAIWNNVLRREFPNLQRLDAGSITCTMARALYHGLPAKLEDAARYIGADDALKDDEGHRLMLRMARPRGQDKTTGAWRWWHEEDPARLDRLKAYCAQDTVVEAAISRALPPLPSREDRIWRADFDMQRRGVALDLGLIRALRMLAEEKQAILDAAMAEVTDGAVTACTQNKRLIDFVNAACVGFDLPEVTSLAKDKLAALLALPDGALAKSARAALEIRKQAAKSSVSKLDRMLDVACADGRARGQTSHYGAKRTGRWAGRLIQVQNLPRGELPKSVDPVRLADEIAAGLINDVDTLEEIAGADALTAISALLRCCLVPSGASRELVTGDYSQIEARVICWLAGQNDVLDVFARGEDVYTYAAAKIGSDNRQLGKVATLGLGFGMGAAKFLDTAAAAPYFVTMDLAEAKRTVDAWRSANKRIVGHWYETERAFKRALWSQIGTSVLVDAPGGTPDVICRRYLDGATRDGTRDVAIRLPSGRDLIYRNVVVGDDDRLRYWGVDQKTGKTGWVETWGGTLVENIVQAVARDIMADALVRLGTALAHGGLKAPVLTVHDEIVCDGGGSAGGLEGLMTPKPGTDWTAGLPIACECGTVRRYRK